MPIEFRPSAEEDLPAIQALMQSAFGSPDAPYPDFRLERWKYFERRPDWDGPRSYVMAQNGEVLAHGCVWPVSEKAICVIDWVSAKAAPGMGILLMRKMGQLAPVILSIGGSEMTQRIMPKIGFVPNGQLLSYARVLRPWKQFRTRPGRHGVRAVARLGRNLAWSLIPKAMPRGWSAEVEQNEPDYIMRCPAARVDRLGLFCSGRQRGECVISRAGGQMRIARISADDLVPAYAAVVEAAMQVPEACELVALAHDGGTRRALEANGFQERARRTVFVFDPGQCLPPEPYPLPIDMLDDDMFYLNFPEYPFLT